MLDIGFLELLMVATLGLLVLGPDKLPGTIRTAIVWWKRLKSSIDSAKHQVENELNYAEMTTHIEEYKNTAKEIGEDIGSLDDIHEFNEKQGKKHAANTSKKPARKTTSQVKKTNSKTKARQTNTD